MPPLAHQRLDMPVVEALRPRATETLIVQRVRRVPQLQRPFARPIFELRAVTTQRSDIVRATIPNAVRASVEVHQPVAANHGPAHPRGLLAEHH